MKLTVGEGKYTFIFEENTGKFRCLRYGKEWRDLVGDGAVLALVQELHDLKQNVENSRVSMEQMEAVNTKLVKVTRANEELNRTNQLLLSEIRGLNFQLNQK